MECLDSVFHSWARFAHNKIHPCAIPVNLTVKKRVKTLQMIPRKRVSMCSLVLYGALDIGDIRDTAEISLKQAACMELVFPGVGVGVEKKEKQRKTALNERGSWRLC